MRRNKAVITTMSLPDTIFRTEAHFPARFADWLERPFGRIFYTDAIPDSHDGNHASLLRLPDDPAGAVREIHDFYAARKRMPHLRRHRRAAAAPDPMEDRFQQMLREAGWCVEHDTRMRWFLLEGESRIAPSQAVAVRQLNELVPAQTAMLRELHNERFSRVCTQRTKHPRARLFTGWLDEKLVTTALWEDFGDVARVDEVNTHPNYRGRGCCRTVIDALVGWHRRRAESPLYLWSDNPTAIRIYIEAGFEEIDCPMQTWTAARRTNSDQED
jgi:GNAT superfamily N-acetyltransferase